MGLNDLELTVSIKHKGKVLWELTEKRNDDILGFHRERDYGLAHAIELMATKLVRSALKEYDDSKWEK